MEQRKNGVSDDIPLALMTSDFTGPVNVGSDEMVTINQLVDMVTEIAHKNLPVVHIPGPPGVRGRNSDNRLIKEKLEWVPSTKLYDGLVATYRWIRLQLLMQEQKVVQAAVPSAEE